MKLSVICPIYNQGYKTLDRFLLCLKEQDFKKFEVIIVYNSPTDVKRQVHKILKDYKKLDIKELDAGYLPELTRGNHCRAFNKGVEIATGDILLFLDPDVYLYPGILREYKDAFDQYDVDFVYGDYDFEGGGRVQGRKYSEYELKCANYISGGFPVKKISFRGWDESLQSLQDWAMWLEVIKSGGKGLYIGRPCFVTDLPKEGGISADQADNWTDRYTTVRNKHSFHTSKMAVTSLGAPLHATNMAEILGVDTRVVNNLWTFKPHDYKTLYLLGFYPLAWQGHMSLFYDGGDIKKKELVGEKRIIHWIGTDLYQLQHKCSWATVKTLAKILKDPEYNFIHLTEFQQTHDELLEFGIESKIVPLPPKNTYDPVAFPKDFTVGVYINPTQDMYFEDFMYQIADAMPDIKFKFFGGGQKKVEENKEWVGWVDMKEFLPTISALVRLTKHDGLPMGPCEAMMAGRNVLTSVKMKHALHTEYENEPDATDIVNKIRELETMPVNMEGSKYWKDELSHEKYIQRIQEL